MNDAHATVRLSQHAAPSKKRRPQPQPRGSRTPLRWGTGVLFGIIALVLGLAHAAADPVKPFPKHWGDPPAIQTRDYVEWPDGYGHGSSTVLHWIKANQEKDARAAAGASTSILYSADLAAVPVGDLPDDFLVLNGDFAVREDQGARVLELPGTPLDSFAVMFGPAGEENLRVTARIQATSKGRRHPSFNLGLNGLGGYRLTLSPARRALELFKGPEDGGETLARSEFEWTSGSWVWLQLQVRRADDEQWQVSGRAWMDGQPQPIDWTVSWMETNKPPAGRPFVGASPFSGTPIRFDHLTVETVR